MTIPSTTPDCDGRGACACATAARRQADIYHGRRPPARAPTRACPCASLVAARHGGQDVLNAGTWPCLEPRCEARLEIHPWHGSSGRGRTRGRGPAAATPFTSATFIRTSHFRSAWERSTDPAGRPFSMRGIVEVRAQASDDKLVGLVRRGAAACSSSGWSSSAGAMVPTWLRLRRCKLLHSRGRRSRRRIVPRTIVRSAAFRELRVQRRSSKRPPTAAMVPAWTSQKVPSSARPEPTRTAQRPS